MYPLFPPAFVRFQESIMAMKAIPECKSFRDFRSTMDGKIDLDHYVITLGERKIKGFKEIGR